MALASRAFAASLKIPPALTRDVSVRRDVPVAGPDGTALLTDLYVARSPEPLPTVLIRCPYGRRGPYGLAARLFAERGYHAVVQSTRGTAGSGGEIDADREAADGRAAADWIVGQDWSNGDIGGFGGSYLTFTQLALASTRPPQLKAMAISVWAAERRAGYYPGGSFALDRALGWIYNIHHQRRSRLALLRAKRDLKPALAHLPLIDADIVAVGQPVSYYRAWLEHEQPGDPYWTPTDFRPVLPDLGVPVTMVAGWYDAFLPYMLADYQALRDGGQPVRLRVGAWRHTSPGLLQHSLRDALDWFETHLRHQPPPEPADDPVTASAWSPAPVPSPAPGPTQAPGDSVAAGDSPAGGSSAVPGPAPSAVPPPIPVQVEVMGGGGWRDLAQWRPATGVQRWHLQPDGALATAAPPPCEPDLYRYDPAEPTPAVGGSSLGTNAGPKDNRELEARPDVLTFTTDPMESALVITGPVSAELYVTSSLAHTDFFARLCDVDPRGRSTNVTDGLIRLTERDPWSAEAPDQESGSPQPGGVRQGPGAPSQADGSRGSDGSRASGRSRGSDGSRQPGRPSKAGPPGDAGRARQPGSPAQAGDLRQVRIDLWPTAYQFRPGHRIRLQVSSGAHPRYARNPGTGDPLATATTLRVAEQIVYHDPERPSAVLLPVTAD